MLHIEKIVLRFDPPRQNTGTLNTNLMFLIDLNWDRSH